ncbi:MAG TPA: cytochrome c [Rhodanobacteraceae bacterium]|nr:cytochrome c [Rhodanobacteraceae bacterium]
MKYLKGMIVLIIVVVIAIAAWIWSGSYNIGADTPHWAFTRYVIGQLREHSIESRSADIKVPNLDDPALVSEGAHHYAEMCTGCHLAPGMGDSELREGLYPRPPNLTHFAPDPAEAFWIIKHGIKMTAMPAWGKTHDDQKIWAMVAYLQKQPHMSVERYRELAGLPAMAPVMSHAATSPAATASAAPAMSAPMTVMPAAPSSAAAPGKAASTH